LARPVLDLGSALQREQFANLWDLKSGSTAQDLLPLYERSG
jgi:hypothetical protein